MEKIEELEERLENLEATVDLLRASFIEFQTYPSIRALIRSDCKVEDTITYLSNELARVQAEYDQYRDKMWEETQKNMAQQLKDIVDGVYTPMAGAGVKTEEKEE